jgi:preprotein translocase subunit SecD
LVLGLVAVCLFLALPLQRKINLGLDLRGGIHMVMRVRTDDAVKAEMDLTRERIRGALQEKGITFASADSPEVDSLVLGGIDPAHTDEARTLIRDQFPQFTLETPGAGSLRLQMRAQDENGVRTGAVKQALETIRTRVDKFGVAEPTIQIKGAGPQADQILVQLPGIDEPERVKDLIGTPAFLEWKLVKVPPGVTADNFRPSADPQAVAAAFGGTLPPDVEVLPQEVTSQDGKHVT